jgi:hypothetical protein
MDGDNAEIPDRRIVRKGSIVLLQSRYPMIVLDHDRQLRLVMDCAAPLLAATVARIRMHER